MRKETNIDKCRLLLLIGNGMQNIATRSNEL